ncbi:MAG TPA: hypothetical protein VLD38_08960 [Nitrosopumilaceae archaeon]|nr:hypothetical protein [Nitrosopumilaceae archaeon]
MKKKPARPSKKGLYFVIIAGAVIIGLVIGVSYYVDQAKISGQRFGTNLEQIQSDLKKQISEYESNLTIWQEGGLTKQQMIQISDNHLLELEKILKRYDGLSPPQAFTSSVELFKRSTQTQIESDKLLKEWIETGDNATKIRSDELLQQSFEYETSALASFNSAKNGYTT